MHLFKPKYKAATGKYRESSNYAVEFVVNGKRVVKSLQTPNQAAAEGKAKLLVARTKEVGWDVLKPRLPGARLKGVEAFGELYRAFALNKEKPLGHHTIIKNIATLRRMAREMEVETVEEMMGKVAGWRSRQTKSPHSVATDLRSAASMFTEDARKYYVEAGWIVVDPFAGMKVPQAEIKPFEGYPLDDVRKLIEAAKKELKAKDEPAYAVFIMALCGGLRAQEAAWVQRTHLRTNGIVVDSDATLHTTKNKKTRFVPLPPSVVAELRTLGGKEAFLMADAPRKNGRKGLGRKRGYRVLKRLSAWLAGKGITAARPVHFLRKIFGSVVATQHGLFAARDYLGHGSVVVTEKHYTALLEKPVVDLMADTSAA
jgi:integrase